MIQNRQIGNDYYPAIHGQLTQSLLFVRADLLRELLDLATDDADNQLRKRSQAVLKDLRFLDDRRNVTANLFDNLLARDRSASNE